MILSDTKLDWLRLSLVKGLGAPSFYKLLQAFDSPTQALQASPAELSGVLKPKAIKALQAGPDEGKLNQTLQWLALQGNTLVTLACSEYPPLLRQLPDPPPVLYAKGRLGLLQQPAIAIVGSRNPTPQGAQNAESFAKALSSAGLAVVSGLALGVDAAAHVGGLQGSGGTIAVVGTGLDRVYPARHHDLAHQIAENGLIVSEFPLGMPPLAENFPRRNRVVSGLSLGCLVVEAALQSGSLITARLAAEQGRDVFAIPGSIHSTVSKGCHALIKQGAKLVESAHDILEELPLVEPLPTVLPSASIDGGGVFAASSASAQVLQHLGFDPCDLETLALRTQMGAEQLSSILLELELEGKVQPLAGCKVQRCG